MYLKDIQADLFIGTNAGNDIYSSITGARKNITILSPYISKKYVNLLVDLGSVGVDVNLITNSDFTNDIDTLDSYKNIIKQHQIVDKKAKKSRILGMSISVLLAILMVGLSIFTYIHSHNYRIVEILSGIALCSIVSYILFFNKRIYSYKYNFLIKPIVLLSKHQKEISYNQFYLHAKIYIIDDEICYISSANLTIMGFRNNYETSFKITDKDKIAEIKKEIHNLIHRESVYIMDYDPIIKLLYQEPKN